MKRSTRALVGMVVIDAGLLLGAIGFISVLLALVFVLQRRKGN